MGKRRKDRKLRADAAPTEFLTKNGESVKVLTKTRNDSWVSAISGLGGGTDKSQGITYVPRTQIAWPELDALYTGFWLARRVVNKLPSIAMVRGFGLTNEENPKDLLAQFNELNFARYKTGAFQRWVRFGRLYGGAGLIVGYSDVGDAYLTPAPTGPNAKIIFLDVVPRHYLTVKRRYMDPFHPHAGMPEIYQITGPHARNGMLIHASRVLRASGLDAPETYQERTDEPEWNLNVLQPVIEDLTRYGTAWQTTLHLLQESTIGVMKMEGLIDALASENQKEIEDRIDILNMSKSVVSMLMLDAETDEEFTRVNTSFSDLPQLMQQMMIGTAGAAEMPVTVLFGQAPSGLNATGESDMRQWYDTVESYQRTQLLPALQMIMTAIAGRDVEVVFPPVWEPSDVDVAQAELSRASADAASFAAGIYEAEEIAAARSMGKHPSEIIDATKRLEDLKKRKAAEAAAGVENSLAQSANDEPDASPGSR